MFQQQLRCVGNRHLRLVAHGAASRVVGTAEYRLIIGGLRGADVGRGQMRPVLKIQPRRPSLDAAQQ